VTGAGGFIGSHLAEFLVEKGYKVRAFVRYNSRNFWGWLEESKYKDKMEVYVGDIRDYDSVYNAMKGIDVVFHLAALISIPYSYVSPLAYIKTNVEGTYNVLQAAKERKVSRIIHTSTSEVYGTAQYIPIDEKHPYNPQSPYAASKAAADHLALSYYRSYGLPVTIIRPFNTYGPRQSARAIIPTIITQILSGKHVIKLGNLRPTRDFNFVKDIVNGFYSVGLHPDTIGDIFNLGTGKEISIKDLAMKIASLMGKDVKIVIDRNRIRPEKSEVERLCADATKAREIAKWYPRYTLDDGLAITIKWFEKFGNVYKSEIYNI